MNLPHKLTLIKPSGWSEKMIKKVIGQPAVTEKKAEGDKFWLNPQVKTKNVRRIEVIVPASSFKVSF